MSKIEEMLKRLCPEGVERVSLGDVCTIKNGSDYKSLGKGDYPVYGSGGIMTYVDAYVYNKPSVLLPRKGSIEKRFYVEGPFWTVDTIYYTVINEKRISPKYLYYVATTFNMSRFNKAGGVPSLTQGDWIRQLVPLPPRPVQDEIVKALDAMDATVKALEEERAARQEQFEAMREKMVNEGEKVELGAVAHYSSERVQTGHVIQGHYVNVESLLPDKRGRVISLSSPHESNCIRFKPGDVLVGNIRPYLKKIWLSDIDGGTNGDVLVVRSSDNHVLDSKYLFYALSQDDFFTYASCKVKAGKMPRGDKASILRYGISIPEIAVQKKVAAQLDAFAAVVAALDEEIAARREQFAGWLEKLMKFDMKEVA